MTPRARTAAVLCCLILVCFPTSFATSQGAEDISKIKSLYIGSLGSDSDAVRVRSNLIRRLRKSHDLQIVPNQNEADAVVKGTARIWTEGHISLNPHSHSAVERVVEGFLSVEILGKANQPLWSYLVTPSKFPWGGVPDDLARQMTSRLLNALRRGTQPEQPVYRAITTLRATLKGAGATFPAPLYQKWFEQFEEEHPGVHINYDPVGSAEGIRELQQGQLDFGASDSPLADTTTPEAHPAFRQIPMVLGAVVPIYNVERLRQRLNFTADVLAGIYLGKIRRWNDPQIIKSNPAIALPDADIVVVHRSDGSGTTFVWSDYLSKVSPDWKASVGTGLAVTWPVGVGAEHNEGVAAAVQHTPNSIGYVELIYAIQHELSFGSVRNVAGEFVKADIPSVTAAARTSENPDSGFRVSITDPEGKGAYPIATYTWLLLPDQIADKEKRATLVELLRWILTSGQKSCSALGYAPLSSDIAKRGLESVNAMP
jgi:phosphate transport system substrate-binding protein